MQKQIFYILSIIALLLLGIEFSYAQLTLPSGSDSIQKSSIQIPIGGGNVGVDVIRKIFFKLLSFARIIIAGFALIYIVLIGANMILHSENESEISKQKKQILYTLIGFAFLNVPTIIYDLFVSDNPSKTFSGVDNWNGVEISSGFINNANVENFLDSLINLLKVAAFIVAVVMLTWGVIKLILDRGKGEGKKDAQNTFLYGGAGLLFLGIIEIWTKTFSSEDLNSAISGEGGIIAKIFGAGFYLAAPVAVFFLILGAYHYITSMGDESKAKKGKAIIFNTFIATIILLASYSILSELNGFFK